LDVFLSFVLGGKPETAQADGQGHIYVNIEDKSELREFDANTLRVMHSWPSAPCKRPSGQAINVAHLLLIIGCHNGLMEFYRLKNPQIHRSSNFETRLTKWLVSRVW
jgi:hypothetical protein